MINDKNKAFRNALITCSYHRQLNQNFVKEAIIKPQYTQNYLAIIWTVSNQMHMLTGRQLPSSAWPSMSKRPQQRWNQNGLLNPNVQPFPAKRNSIIKYVVLFKNSTRVQRMFQVLTGCFFFRPVSVLSFFLPAQPLLLLSSTTNLFKRTSMMTTKLRGV